MHQHWWRVVYRAAAARRGDSGAQPGHTRAVRAEKWVLLRGKAWTGMRMRAVLFGPCTPDVLTARIAVFSHDFKTLDPLATRATSAISAE
jgi:hypothetical protein